MLYTDFSDFTRDQEYLISMKGNGNGGPAGGFDYVEGSLINDESHINNWRSSSFFSKRDHGRIAALAAQHSIIYCLEVCKYYGDFGGPTSVDQVGIHYPDPTFLLFFAFFFFFFGSVWQSTPNSWRA